MARHAFIAGVLNSKVEILEQSPDGIFKVRALADFPGHQTGDIIEIAEDSLIPIREPGEGMTEEVRKAAQEAMRIWRGE